jgi:hypothetical protein
MEPRRREQEKKSTSPARCGGEEPRGKMWRWSLEMSERSWCRLTGGRERKKKNKFEDRTGLPRVYFSFCPLQPNASFAAWGLAEKK